jgi:hypothetical protein
MMISATFRNSFHLSFTIHKSRLGGYTYFSGDKRRWFWVLIVGWVGGYVALDEEIHHINVRYLCRDLIYVLRGIFWINNGCTFIDQDYRRLFTQL